MQTDRVEEALICMICNLKKKVSTLIDTKAQRVGTGD
jgi:hypothetical protein